MGRAVGVPRLRPLSPCWLFEPLLSGRARGRPRGVLFVLYIEGRRPVGGREAPLPARPAPVTLLFKACACGVAGLLAAVCGVGFSFAPSSKSFHFSRGLLQPASARSGALPGLPEPGRSERRSRAAAARPAWALTYWPAGLLPPACRGPVHVAGWGQTGAGALCCGVRAGEGPRARLPSVTL